MREAAVLAPEQQLRPPHAPALAAVNYLTGPPYWILWVLLGWSVGLIAHWLFGVRLAGSSGGRAG